MLLSNRDIDDQRSPTQLVAWARRNPSDALFSAYQPVREPRISRQHKQSLVDRTAVPVNRSSVRVSGEGSGPRPCPPGLIRAALYPADPAANGYRRLRLDPCARQSGRRNRHRGMSAPAYRGIAAAVAGHAPSRRDGHARSLDDRPDDEHLQPHHSGAPAGRGRHDGCPARLLSPWLSAWLSAEQTFAPVDHRRGAFVLRLLEPTEGVEPTTGGLQNRCSTVELRRPGARF